MKPRISLREALSDPNLLGRSLAGDSWKAWRTLLIAAMGEELRDDERAIFTKLTGREREPLRPVEEFVAVVGRRGGKRRALATFAAYISGLAEHPSLVPGERGVVLCIAPDTRQASIALEYCAAVFEQSPIFANLDHRANHGHAFAEQPRGHRGEGRKLSSAERTDLRGRHR